MVIRSSGGGRRCRILALKWGRKQPGLGRRVGGRTVLYPASQRFGGSIWDSRAGHVPQVQIGDLVANVAAVEERIAAGVDRAGRSLDEVGLLPVSKTVSKVRIRPAVPAGCTELGEDSVQEARRRT